MKKNFLILLPLVLLSARSLFVFSDHLINSGFTNWRTYAGFVGACATVGLTLFFLRAMRRKTAQ
jgi:hypothetical protein